MLLVAGFVGVMLLPPRGRATIQEQRARLPPAATDCTDPVAGVWKSHAYYPYHGQWYIFHLHIRRRPENREQLVGEIHSEFWSGGPRDEQPPPCRPGHFHNTVIMPAEGWVRGQQIHFGGTSWRNDRTFCGSPTYNYYPDRFSGTIDPSILEFQSVNNDGGPMVNYPTVFRRVRCAEEPDEAAPHVVARPPAFYPEQGCGCRR
ncbi:MAG: hypothetical protein NZ898_07565 [Myxococcota bacterium]|nr:hypothetical protein [Myxococcota bacterium]MDW8363042.1 hypothetical protein [Myxococcales bacterium]